MFCRSGPATGRFDVGSGSPTGGRTGPPRSCALALDPSTAAAAAAQSNRRTKLDILHPLYHAVVDETSVASRFILMEQYGPRLAVRGSVRRAAAAAAPFR